MVNTDQDPATQQTLSRLQLLMFLRVTLVSLLLGVAVIIEVRETKTFFGEIVNAHYSLIAAVYFLTFLYVIAFRYVRNLTKFAYVQILLDTILITAIIHTTGGIESMFSLLYLLSIISGSIILYRRGGLMVASFSIILYGALLDLNYYGLINSMGSYSLYPQDYQSDEVFYRILVNGAAFYVVGFLSSFLSEQSLRSETALKAKQKDMADLEMLNENIIQSISSGLVAVDEYRKIIVFNKGAEGLFDVESTDAIRRDVYEVIPFIQPYLEGKNPNKFNQIVYQGGDGKQIDLLLNISSLTDQDGNKKGEILFFQDMTRVREMEREVKRMEDLAMLGELSAAIAHEIRNPLASISGSIQVLDDSLSREDALINERLMDIISREINRLNHMVSDFLQFARPQSKEVEKFDLNQLIGETLYIFQNSRSWSSNLEVEKKISGPLEMGSDPQQLKQVLWNILLNASEAMPKGGVIRVSTEKVNGFDGSGGSTESVKIKVEDNGPGIDPKVIKDMFKPFSTTKKGGSGLGLAIVRRIVDGLGGEVSGQNLTGGGAAITIVLPLQLKEESRGSGTGG
ncbi:MAG: PAS domain-containing protein [Deltaproteobacteria bacterium]|nr:MAG: PAS domain-containing protein [Deltaproteobacteria bacterium]